MKKILWLSLAIVFLAVLFYLLKTGDEMEIQVGSSLIPQRIISLGPPITESLYLLGVEDKLMANTTYCIRPKEARDKEKIGDTMRANLEEIINIKPDLVLATSLSNPKQTQRLRDLGIEVISFSDPANFSQLCRDFLKLGKIVGQEKESVDIVQNARERVDAVQQRIRDLPGTKALVQIGARPLWVAPGDSFIDDLVRMAGGINIGPFGKSGLYSLEEVLKANPDVIIIATMGIVGQTEKKSWQRYKSINAVKENRIYIMDSYKLCSPTAVTFVEALEEIAEILHPNEVAR
ncbi:ABC transporter substrate-binding protein [bacterium]|nr:ABC transporter substrate-binding protein [bacterium]MBU1614339.1 ABC transporter substrate-binding protein [bacterium]